MDKELLHFDETINKIQFVFLFAGINIRSRARKASDRFKSRFVYIINLLWVNFDLSGSIRWFIVGMSTGKDFLELTCNLPGTVMCFLGQFKAAFLVWNENLVHELMDNLRNLEIKEKTRRQSSKKDEIVKQEIKFLNYVLKTISILYSGLIMTFAVTPIILIVIKYYQTKELELVLPLLILYPFDPFQIKRWPFVYLYQFWTECAVSLDGCSADYFFYVCCTYIRIQFRLLQHELENLIPVKANFNKIVVANDELKNNLKELVTWHQDLIASVNILELIYSKLTLLIFLTSSFIICLTGFNVTIVDDIALIVSFLIFLFVSLMQVFFLCFFADLLMSSSMEISDAVYNCQHYMVDINFRKKLFFIQLRSQKPCKITAASFAVVSLKSFMKVLSTSWSYFALLQTMYGSNVK